MPDSADFPPARGDEADLFRAFHATLMRSVARSVGTSSPQVVEDACAFAWAAFLERQPDRDRNWRGWLYRTAERHAWRLERVIHQTESLEPAVLDEADVEALVSPLDEIEMRNTSTTRCR